jgi:uroporphyrinogen decarboxylase
MWHETMTSAERMGALMRGERPDRVPVSPLIFGHTASVCGQPIARIYDDPATSFRCQLLAQEMYGYDGLPVMAYASVGAWEFGGDIEMPVKKYAGAPVVTRTPVQNEDDVYTLEVPEDVSKAGFLPLLLEFGRILVEHHMPVTIFPAAGSFGLAGSIMGEERMLRWMIKKPELVQIVIDKALTFTLRVIDHFVREFGVENLRAFEGEATGSNRLISPGQFATFALPSIKVVAQRIVDLGIPAMFHICGDHNKNLPYWREVPMGPHTVLSFGREVALEKAMEMFPDQVIAGNVDPTLIQEGTAEEVLAQARECIEVAKHHKGGYILMSGCDIPPQAPPVNVFQLIKAAREYGRY